MNLQFFGVKGGSTTSTVAACTALLLAADRDVTIIDHSVDMPALLGVPQPYEANYNPLSVVDRLQLASANYFWGDPDHDLGMQVHDMGLARVMVPGAMRLLVIKPCYLALRQAVATDVQDFAEGFVLSNEPGRALTERDCERALGIKHVATVNYDPMVARSIDAGLVTARMPLSMRDGLEPVVSLAKELL